MAEIKNKNERNSTMRKERCVTWTIGSFPKKLKDEFVGLAKMQGKNAKKLLQHLVKGWVVDQKKEIK